MSVKTLTVFCVILFIFVGCNQTKVPQPFVLVSVNDKIHSEKSWGIEQILNGGTSHFKFSKDDTVFASLDSLKLYLLAEYSEEFYLPKMIDLMTDGVECVNKADLASVYTIKVDMNHVLNLRMGVYTEGDSFFYTKNPEKYRRVSFSSPGVDFCLVVNTGCDYGRDRQIKNLCEEMTGRKFRGRDDGFIRITL